MDDELAQVFGYESAEDYNRSMAEREKLRNKSKEFYNKKPKDWPTIKFNWDYRPECQRYCFDSISKSVFDNTYSNGLVLGHMPLKEFDKYLCHYSRRDGDELWKLGSQSKLAKMIVYLSEGKPITPPVIKPVENKEVIFQGGHHRYAVAKAIELQEISIYAYAENIEELNEFMNIRWAEA
ncbi:MULTISPECIES: transcriptional regulator [unclassified Shewanella]|uniref:transcriptional regulator n=1 Tax=unclassified Shewanella TaxID=196818 RepID=UPI000CB026AF|nr:MULTISPECIES: transcriptional regulator [unclassified Shewanella]MBB1391160.1 transcriptional regulator [Shewanella sp. SG44-6]PIX72276.1 MAG: transcriptional regulator [Shewanella sp. CG_4_10_14_3_um_filter_42_91]PIY64960.1 MAG: transcriptional regulator [Shewanella sp. CG_4_10_14_0_8_um_filter_42_13]